MWPWLLLAAATAAAGADAEALAVERALREGRIVSVAPLGEGITNSSRVELRDGARTCAPSSRPPTFRLEKSPYRFGSETVGAYRDTYRHEVAAYELDKLLGLRLVPPVVERKIGKKKGSLQAWVDRALPRFAPRSPARGHEPRGRGDARHAPLRLPHLQHGPPRAERGLPHRLAAGGHRQLDRLPSVPAPVPPALPLPPRSHRAPPPLDARSLRRALGRYLENDELAGIEERRARGAPAGGRGRLLRTGPLFEW
jgi:hypothetical protein